MGVLNVLRIAGSALTAQRLRMDVTASNIANAEATATPEGGPYRAERVVFAPRGRLSFANTFRLLRRESDPAPVGEGVQVQAIVASPQPPRQVYDPTHPDADADGYVTYPNVDLVTEMTDLLSASRAYEANLTVINVAKNMAQRALDIGRV
ncbi:MAG: flagellar basal body rod protein FlgC [Chloroflexi bacterium]|nr:flagellar basal body rod protein FlgC [Chloroflexota bacterium]